MPSPPHHAMASLLPAALAVLPGVAATTSAAAAAGVQVAGDSDLRATPRNLHVTDGQGGAFVVIEVLSAAGFNQPGDLAERHPMQSLRNSGSSFGIAAGLSVRAQFATGSRSLQQDGRQAPRDRVPATADAIGFNPSWRIGGLEVLKIQATFALPQPGPLALWGAAGGAVVLGAARLRRRP